MKRGRRSAAPVKVTVAGETTTVPASRIKREAKKAKPPKWKLSANQRHALFAGGHPRLAIAEEEECDLQPGDIVDVPGSKTLWLGIIGVKEGLPGFLDELVYKVYDERPRLLRASVHGVDFEAIRSTFDSRGRPQPMRDPHDLSQAAEESGYTHSPGAALPGEPEAVSRADQEAQSEEARKARKARIKVRIDKCEEALGELEEDENFSQHGSTVRYLRNRLRKLQAELERELGVEEARSHEEVVPV